MKYSIIIPTYNHNDLLTKCIHSLENYTDLSNAEIIVVANGCNYSTKFLLDIYSNDIENFSYLFFDEPMGYTKATNEGIKAAEGEYIVLLNDDTELLPEEKNTWLNILHYPFTQPRGNLVAVTGPMKEKTETLDREFILFFCAMIPKVVFDKLGLLDEIFSPGYGEDTDFALRAENAGYITVRVPAESSYTFYDEKRRVSNFPIYHVGNQTFKDHPDPELIHRNNRIIFERYGKKDAIGQNVENLDVLTWPKRIFNNEADADDFVTKMNKQLDEIYDKEDRAKKEAKPFLGKELAEKAAEWWSLHQPQGHIVKVEPDDKPVEVTVTSDQIKAFGYKIPVIIDQTMRDNEFKLVPQPPLDANRPSDSIWSEEQIKSVYESIGYKNEENKKSDDYFQAFESTGETIKFGELQKEDEMPEDVKEDSLLYEEYLVRQKAKKEAWFPKESKDNNQWMPYEEFTKKEKTKEDMKNMGIPVFTTPKDDIPEGVSNLEESDDYKKRIKGEWIHKDKLTEPPKYGEEYLEQQMTKLDDRRYPEYNQDVFFSGMLKDAKTAKEDDIKFRVIEANNPQAGDTIEIISGEKYGYGFSINKPTDLEGGKDLGDFNNSGLLMPDKSQMKEGDIEMGSGFFRPPESKDDIPEGLFQQPKSDLEKHFPEEYNARKNFKASMEHNIIKRMAESIDKSFFKIERAKQIDGFMSDEELLVLARYATTAKVFVEVGSWHGKSSRAIANNLPTDGVLYCVDTWKGSESEQNTHHASAKAQDGDDAYLWFLNENWDLIQSGNIIPLRMTSANASKFLQGKYLKANVIFIDAGHTKEEVKSDIEAWLPVLENDGIICGHDYGTCNPDLAGVTKAVNEAFMDTATIEPFTSIWKVQFGEVKFSDPVYDCPPLPDNYFDDEPPKYIDPSKDKKDQYSYKWDGEGVQDESDPSVFHAKTRKDYFVKITDESTPEMKAHYKTLVPANKREPCVFDCFPFNNELDILEIRFNETYDVVDRYVIVEAKYTHSGKEKELVFHNNLKRFEKFLNKVTYLVIEKFPEQTLWTENPNWARENYQRDYIMNGLQDCQDDDFIIISDADEIPNAETVKKYKDQYSDKNSSLWQMWDVVTLHMYLYYYNFNTKANDLWDQAKMTLYKTVKTKTPCGVRYSQHTFNAGYGGWHLSYFADPEGIIKKIEATAHQEYNKPEFKYRGDIQCKIDNLEDIFGRDNIKFEHIPFINWDNLPKWLPNAPYPLVKKYIKE